MHASRYLADQSVVEASGRTVVFEDELEEVAVNELAVVEECLDETHMEWEEEQSAVVGGVGCHIVGEASWGAVAAAGYIAVGVDQEVGEIVDCTVDVGDHILHLATEVETAGPELGIAADSKVGQAVDIGAGQEIDSLDVVESR